MTSHLPPKQTKRISKAVIAKQLGVTREHLSRVLHGHRESRSLTARYKAFVKAAAKEGAAK